MSVEEVKGLAQNAKIEVLHEFAWVLLGEVKDGKDFDQVLEIVSEVNAMGLKLLYFRNAQA